MADDGHGGASRAGGRHTVFFGGRFDCSSRVGYLFALLGIPDGTGFYAKA